MSGESKTTTDHETIRIWAEERGGVPTTVSGTETGEKVGVLRIHFKGYSDESNFDEITWDEFFEKFEENNLALIYQEETADGKQSRFCKLVNRDEK